MSLNFQSYYQVELIALVIESDIIEIVDFHRSLYFLFSLSSVAGKQPADCDINGLRNTIPSSWTQAGQQNRGR
jgi:hypothetical protein